MSLAPASAAPRSRWRGAGAWFTRLSFLALALLLTLTGPLPEWLAVRLENVEWLHDDRVVHTLRALPAASPLAWFSGAVTGRGLPQPWFWLFLPLALLGLACWRNRFFCNRICPAGTLYALGAKVSLKKKILPTRLNGILFWCIIISSLFGFSALLALDPLSSFQRLPLLAKPAASAAAWIPGVVVPFFLLLGVFQPLIWCSHFCPLGYSFDLAHACARRRPAGGIRVDSVRRDLLVGAAIGAPLALLGRFMLTRSAQAKAAQNHLPVLPPGAGTPQAFASRCSRCYACVQACPEKVIRVKSAHLTDPAAAFSPELDYDRGYCKEHCSRCTQVCPVGALVPLTQAEKARRQIGIALIERAACIAWADNGYCMVCQEMCPYQAIDDNWLTLPDGNEVNRPVVNPDRCRGCGHCQLECPAQKPGKAIRVAGVPQQVEL